MSTYEFGDFRLNVSDRCLLRNGQVVPVPPKPFDILVLLVESKGHLITKEHLMMSIWPDALVEDSNLTVSMAKLRKLLGENKQRHYIATLPRLGYRFVANVRSVQICIESIAVLPFQTKNTEPEIVYLSEILTDALIYQLSKCNFKVTPPGYISSCQDHGVNNLAGINTGFNADAVLTGKLSTFGDSVTINAELLDVSKRELLWGEQYHRRISDVLTERDIADEIVASVELMLPRDQSIAQRRVSRNPSSRLTLVAPSRA